MGKKGVAGAKSGWKAYQATGEVCGVHLPSGLRESDRLPEPILTPSTKAEKGGHDESVSRETLLERGAKCFRGKQQTANDENRYEAQQARESTLYHECLLVFAEVPSRRIIF